MTHKMDRYWLLTSTTYGQRLPGDERSFVSRVHDKETGELVRHNVPGTPFDRDHPNLLRSAQDRMTGEPILLSIDHAEALLRQFQETAEYRCWQLLAVGIMANHIHIVVGVPGDPAGKRILGTFKSYGSRKLNELWGVPKADTWWTDGGSTKKLPDEDSVLAAVNYVLNQEFPLLIWTAPIPELNLRGGRIV